MSKKYCKILLPRYSKDIHGKSPFFHIVVIKGWKSFLNLKAVLPIQTNDDENEDPLSWADIVIL